MKTKILVLATLLSITIFSCTYDSEDDFMEPIEDPNNGGNNGNGGSTVNYVNNVQPIMQASCVSCHASPPVNGAPFSLVTFDQVSQRANGILNAMSRQSGAAGAMPPSGRLPQGTIDIIQQWIDNGKPEN